MKMGFSYNNLWKLLIDRNMTKTELKEQIGISPSTLARLSKNQNVSLDVLGKICEQLDCSLDEIIEYEKEDGKGAK